MKRPLLNALVSRRRLIFAASPAPLLLSACGYHVGTHADLVPKNIHSIAIPAFGNTSIRYKLTDRLPEAISREFISRTRYRIEPDPNVADAVLRGTISNVVVYPIVFDPSTSRASGVQIIVTMGVSLFNRATGAVIWSRPSFEVKNRYEIAVQAQFFFDESEDALQRVAKEAARTIVSGILENF
ncbi:MAG: LPS assembly lipoprotein LptE [Bryobacteraceae bacterium]